jgi:outer membrane immunogenic protein
VPALHFCDTGQEKRRCINNDGRHPSYLGGAKGAALTYRRRNWLGGRGMIWRGRLATTTATACVVGISAFAASAADLVRKAPILKAPPPVAAYDWTGFYVGANAGVGIAGTTVTDPSNRIGDRHGDTDDLYGSGFSGGGQVGFNRQITPNIVVGVEGDIGILSTKRSLCDLDHNCAPAGSGAGIHLTSESDFFSTLRARAGYAWDRVLLYATAGGAWVRVKDSWTNEINDSLLHEKTRTLSGWTAGGGVEAALWGPWTVKVEYLYIDVGTNSFADTAAANGGRFLDFKHQYHVARLGANYRFGSTAVASVPSAAVYQWTGAYLGLNAGVGISGTELTDPSSTLFSGPGDGVDLFKTGFTGGVQAGYNRAIAPNWIVGAEGDLGVLSTKRSFCDLADCGTIAPLTISSKSGFFSTLRARAGYAWDRAVLYATGGAAWVHVTDSWFDLSGGVNGHRFNEHSTTLSGWTVGGGLEAALVGNWTGKIEYLFVDAGTNKVYHVTGDGTFLGFKHEYHVARFGLNYRFGDYPIIAKY